MNTSMPRVLYWTPRVLSILLAVFLSVLAIDVFGEGYGFWQTIGALLLHLIPSFLVVIALVIAWRREWVGAVLFIAFALFYLVSTWGRFPWGAYLVLPGIPVLIGVLFWLNWRYREQLRTQ